MYGSNPYYVNIVSTYYINITNITYTQDLNVTYNAGENTLITKGFLNYSFVRIA